MQLIYYGLQPLLMIGVLTVWYFNQSAGWIYPAIVIGVQLLLGLLEYRWPARPDWLHGGPYKTLLAAVFVGTYVFGGVIVEPFYSSTLNPFLSGLRADLNLDIWPTGWPMAMQVMLALFLSEFIWYWLHRAEHRWQWIWRITGHGSHHAFHNLGAVNAGANHPLEVLLVLSVPSAIVELLLGAGPAIAGSYLLLVTLAFLAHANLRLNTRVIGWLFTINRYHIHHHSAVHEESNTNFGCAVILWDRLFGTFSDAPTKQTGTGPTQPSLWKIFIMPYREPEDTTTAPVRSGS